MHIALWAVAGILAAAFAFAGFAKVASPREKLLANGMAYVEDFSDGAIKTIGGLEVLGALALVVPPIVNVAPVLVPIAAIGLAVIMVGAVAVHIRRKEPFIPPLALGILAAFVAIGRLWLAPF